MHAPENWNVETEEINEIDGITSYTIDLSAPDEDVRSIGLSYGPLPKGSDAYSQACCMYDEVVGEEDLETNNEPILNFEFQGHKAHGFSLMTDEMVPCFFFCVETQKDNQSNLLTAFLCAPGNEELQNLLDFLEEHLSC